MHACRGRRGCLAIARIASASSPCELNTRVKCGPITCARQMPIAFARVLGPSFEPCCIHKSMFLLGVAGVSDTACSGGIECTRCTGAGFRGLARSRRAGDPHRSAWLTERRAVDSVRWHRPAHDGPLRRHEGGDACSACAQRARAWHDAEQPHCTPRPVARRSPARRIGRPDASRRAGANAYMGRR